MALLAWLVFPLLALAICIGIGLLAERLARAELEPALLPALGFAAAIVVLGAAVGDRRRRRCRRARCCVAARGRRLRLVAARPLAARCGPGLGALAGVAVYVLYIAPVALSGKVTFLGYNLLNDTAIHLALVDWIGDHGSRYIAAGAVVVRRGDQRLRRQRATRSAATSCWRR